MRSTMVLRASQARQPMIKFLGKRQSPQSVDHTPRPHPASPTQSLPDSFAAYRSRAQQHGPAFGKNGGGHDGGPMETPNPWVAAKTAPATPVSNSVAAKPAYGNVGGRSGRSLGSVRPKEGEFFDRSELPARFRRMSWTDAEMDAVSSGGATLRG